MVESKPLVVITGITGFLGMYVVREFLQDGSMRVRGTMRNMTEARKAPLREALGPLFD